MQQYLALGYYLILFVAAAAILYSAWAISLDVETVNFSLGTNDYSFTCPISGLH